MKNHDEVTVAIINDNISELKDKSGISDGDHTFGDLYHHRMILFAVILKSNKFQSWRSKLHYDGNMYDNYFICGINTPEGSFTYHYHMDYWDFFDGVTELKRAPKWDGHTAEDVTRLFSLLKGE